MGDPVGNAVRFFCTMRFCAFCPTCSRFYPDRSVSTKEMRPFCSSENNSGGEERLRNSSIRSTFYVLSFFLRLQYIGFRDRS